MDDLQAIVNKVNDIGRAYNMKINAKKKKKLMVISRVANKPRVKINKEVTEIVQVAKSICLGYFITEDGTCDETKRGSVQQKELSTE